MIYGVIMAGGSGTRFWPESRVKRPKQLLTITGDRAMIRATVERIAPIIPFPRVMVVTAKSHADEIRGQLPELSADLIVVEPVGRNTAPCIALAALKLWKRDPDAIMVVLPSDHVIGRPAEFLSAITRATDVAQTGDCLVTLGIVPNRPETGYGYIKLGKSELDVPGCAVFTVDRFVEKPDLAAAEGYLASGRYMWNSGMFVWKAATVIRAFERHLPSVSQALAEVLPHLNTPAEADALKDVYERLESISIDFGILEKAPNVFCIPIDVHWNDVGSWASLADVWECDAEGNATKGEVVLIDAGNCVISSPHKLTALIGVDDLIVVDTPDALMICRKDRAQDVRRLQETLRQRGYEELL